MGDQSAMIDRSWSQDSIPQLHDKPLLELNKPKKHARRLSLHQSVGNGDHGGNTAGHSLDGIREWRKSTKSTTKSLHNGASRRFSQGNTQTLALRRRLMAEANSNTVGIGNPFKQRRTVIGSSAMDDTCLMEVKASDDDDDDDDSASITDRTHRRHQASAAPSSSAPHSNATYSAGPSRRGPIGYASSSDDAVSSSEFEAFDWDTTLKKNFDRPRSLPSEGFVHRVNTATTAPATQNNNHTTNSDRNHHQPILRLNSRNSSNAHTSKSSPKTSFLALPNVDVSTSKALSVNGYTSFNKVGVSDRKSASSASHDPHSNAQTRRRKLFSSRINPSVEALMIAGAAVAACFRLAHDPTPETQSHVLELALITALSTIYFFVRDPNQQATIWATDHRNYRQCGEDGALNALLFGPLSASACLISALQDFSDLHHPPALASGEPLPSPLWRVQGPLTILNHNRPTPHQLPALVLSRYSLVSLMCLTSTAMLCHLVATKWIKPPHQFPTDNWQKFRSFTLFSITLTVILEVIRQIALFYRLPLWADLARWEVFTVALFFQANLYTISRLARKSFTLGELGMVASFGVALTMETIYLCIAKLLPATTPFVKTFRSPTPLLVFQLALIVGTFMIGFLLSPLLYLSRNLAQKPTHRLRWPDKRNLHRRLLAGFFYLFAGLYVVGVLGMWVRWMLVKRDPWVWALGFLLKGHRPWSRLVLVTYWAALVAISISCWQAVVSNAKRFRALGGVFNRSQGSKTSSTVNLTTTSQPDGTTTGIDKPEGANKRNSGVNLHLNSIATTALGKEGNTVAIKKASHLSLNARRKFFHALAVVLFVPGIAFDPAFTHLAFSLAFSLFIFAEYVRYYALYPFGAALHVFMSEFLDHKDSGPVILSHFYLLSGCSAPVWIEGRSQIIHQTGVLVLGIGDALASVIGRRYGRLYWPTSSKTVEGTAAFFGSILFSAWLLRLLGFCEYFNMWKYSFIIASLGLLEGVSDQHDNLILPIFAIIMGSLVNI